MSDKCTEEAFKALKDSIDDAIRYTLDAELVDDQMIYILDLLDERGFQVVMKTGTLRNFSKFGMDIPMSPYLVVIQYLTHTNFTVKLVPAGEVVVFDKRSYDNITADIKSIVSAAGVPEDRSTVINTSEWKENIDNALQRRFVGNPYYRGLYFETIGTGHIPCKDCVKRPQEEVIAEITQRRVVSVAFPRGGCNSPAECLEFLLAAASGKLESSK